MGMYTVANDIGYRLTAAFDKSSENTLVPPSLQDRVTPKLTQGRHNNVPVLRLRRDHGRARAVLRTRRQPPPLKPPWHRPNNLAVHRTMLRVLARSERVDIFPRLGGVV